MEFGGADHGSSGSAGVRCRGEAGRGVSGEDTEARRSTAVSLSTAVHMKPTNICLLCATFLDLSALSAQQPAQDLLLRWMDQIAQRQLQRRENAIAEIHKIGRASCRGRGEISVVA